MTEWPGDEPLVIPITGTSKEWSTPILYPHNLQAIWNHLAKVNLWPGTGYSMPGNEARVSAVANLMNFIPAAQQARIGMSAVVTATKRPPEVVLAFTIRLSFQVDRYFENDRTGVIYQDILRVETTGGAEAASTQWTMNKATMAPWLFSTTTTTESYDPANPMTLVADKVTTTWLKDPQAEAMGQCDFVHVYAMGIPLGWERGDMAFALTQRVMYARVVGRSGAEGAKIGGVGVIVPAYFQVNGKLRVDLTNKSLSIVDDSQEFKKFRG
jgi:hypothetical protein